MKYFIILFSLFMLAACDAKTNSAAAKTTNTSKSNSSTQIAHESSAEQVAPASEAVAGLKSGMEEKVEMAKDKMGDVKEAMASKVDDMGDKVPEVDKMSDNLASAKADMEDKADMSDKEVPMAKEEVTETVASTATAIATTTTAVTPVVAKEVMEDKKEAMPVAEKKAMPVAGVDHSKFDKLLKKYVSSSGVVNYAGINGVRGELNDYLALVSQKTPDKSWSRNESLAYWINVYNANTIDLILSNYPTSSITNLDGGKPWDVKRITLAGKKYSLNDIEHSIIRPEFNDARIHFAVNCAAKSCPKINNGAMTAANVNSTLEKLTKQFVNNTAANQISAGSASLSKIFEWYASDFGNLTAFINKYSTQKLDSGASISYVDYDWALNGK